MEKYVVMKLDHTYFIWEKKKKLMRALENA